LLPAVTNTPNARDPSDQNWHVNKSVHHFTHLSTCHTAIGFSSPCLHASHNNTPLFPTIPRLVSHNHINSLQAPTRPVLLFLSLATAFASVSSGYTQKNPAFASSSHCLLSISFSPLWFARSYGPYPPMTMMTPSPLDVFSSYLILSRMPFNFYILHLFLMFSSWIFYCFWLM